MADPQDIFIAEIPEVEVSEHTIIPHANGGVKIGTLAEFIRGQIYAELEAFGVKFGGDGLLLRNAQTGVFEPLANVKNKQGTSVPVIKAE